MELKPEWISGFVDGEGCFHIAFLRHAEMKFGYQILPEFTVVQHVRDKDILFALKRYFGFGVVRKNHQDRWCYRVRKLENLLKICEFFTRFPLRTKKRVDFQKFKKAINMMKAGKHLTKDGFIEILEIALRMNTGNRERLLQIIKDLENG